jgi:outer membrane protein TolC
VPMDIDVVEKVIKSSVEEALKRMRQAEARLTKVQQGRVRAEMSIQLAEALAEYNRGVAELTEYLNVSKRQSPHPDTDDDTHT